MQRLQREYPDRHIGQLGNFRQTPEVSTHYLHTGIMLQKDWLILAAQREKSNPHREDLIAYKEGDPCTDCGIYLPF